MNQDARMCVRASIRSLVGVPWDPERSSMRIFVSALIVGVVVGIVYFQGSVGSALTCSDIERTYDYEASPCEQIMGIDDMTINRYRNNHDSDDIWITVAVAGPNNVASYQVLSPNAFYVENGQTSGSLTVTGLRTNDCSEETSWTTKASLSGNPICDNTEIDHVFEFDCCDL